MSARPAAALPAHLVTLLDPATYPHPAPDVTLAQTHISWVFLAGDYAYKVKRPVDFGFLDFTTLPRRRYYCRQEVVLNGRLCAGTYLGVVPLRERDGTVHLGGAGRVVEYAVRMRRLPAERMLDRLALAGAVTDGEIDAIAAKLAAFHQDAPTTGAISRYGSPRAIRRNWDENFEQTAPFVGDTITPFQYAYLREYVRATLRRRRALLRQRQREGRIRDCHGDLRASSICLADGICIYDCIEFNARFRYGDVASDVAFLAMDLEALGRPDLAEHFIQRYATTANDPGLPAVLDFYRCYRAFVRGKVDSFQAGDLAHSPEDRARAAGAARRRFAQAVADATRDQPPCLLVVCGLPGSGKTSVARAVAGRLGASVLSSDVVRKQLAGLEPTARRRGAYQADIYRPAFTRRTYRELLLRARAELAAGRSVVLDATFGRAAWRAQAARLAGDAGALLLLLECRTTDDEVRRRLLARASDPTSASDATWSIYLDQRDAYEPLTGYTAWQHVVLDTAGPLPAVLAAAWQALQDRLHPGAGQQLV